MGFGVITATKRCNRDTPGPVGSAGGGKPAEMDRVKVGPDLAQREIADVGERLQLLTEAVRDYAIFLLDADGTVASWNPGAARLHGYRGEEIIGYSFAHFYPPEEVADGGPDRDLGEAIRLGSATCEGWRIRKDGSRFWAHIVLTALRGEDGSLRGFAKVTRDDTEGRASRQRAAALQETVAALLAGQAADDVLALLTRHARHLCGAVRTWLSVVGDDDDTLRTAAADGLEIGPGAGETFPAVGTVAAQVMRSRQPQLVADVATASSVGHRLTGLGQALAVPLLAGDHVLGVLVAAAETTGPAFRPIDLDMLAVFAAQAAVVIEYDRTQQTLRSHLLDQDRARIATDLQHGAIQRLFKAGLALESISQHTIEPALRQAIADVIEQLDATIRDLRAAVFELGHDEDPSSTR